MFNFISDNFISCIALMISVLSFVMGLKLKNFDRMLIKKKLADTTFSMRNKMLFGSKLFRICYVVTVIIFSAVIYCKLENIMPIVWALVVAILSSVIIAFAFIELILAISAVLRKLIAVNSILLNVMFSSVIIMLVLVYSDMMLAQGFDKLDFILSFLCLSICYISMVVILINILKEANDENSRLTVRNIWKSACLTIILFLFVLALMSMSCQLYDSNSFKGTNGGLVDMLYYTVITFATVGYGDITPVSIMAKGISILTVVTYILSITVLLSEIVGLNKKKTKK